MFSFYKKDTKKISIEKVLHENPHHKWIRDDKNLYRFFKTILSLLTKEDFMALNSTKELCFLYSPGRYASALPSDKNYNFVIIYPEMIKMINSVDNSMALAVIFHELGHLRHEHHKDKRPSLDKQIEADQFAVKYGLINEILELLYSENQSFEVAKRIEYIQNQYRHSKEH